MSDFFPIETPYSSEEYKIMQSVVNKGIDSHLEAFTKSEFKKSPSFNNKFLWNIHNSELPILYRRLEELYNETGNDDYQSFLDDVKSVAGGEIDEMVDPYDPMDMNQTISGEPTATSDLAVGGVDTAPAYAQGQDFSNNQGIENYIDDDTLGQELEIDESELRKLVKSQVEGLTNEDSQMKRHQAGQRGKDFPLGQHGPQSQAAKK